MSAGLRRLLSCLSLISIVVITDCVPGEPLPPAPVPEALWFVRGVGAFVWPVADDQTVFFASEDSSHVVAIEKTSGRVRWRLTPTRGSVPGTPWSLIIAGDILITATGDLHGVDRATGKPRWTFTAANGDGFGEFGGRLAVEGTTVFATTHGNRVYAIDTRSGALRWIRQLPVRGDGGAGDPVVGDGQVFVGVTHGSDNPATGSFVALDAATGETRWTHDFRPAFPGALSGAGGNAVIRAEHVIVGCLDGTIYAFDRVTGEIRWTSPRVQPIPPAPGGYYADRRPLAIAGDVVVAGSNRLLRGLDAATGAALWDYWDLWAPLAYTADSDTYYAIGNGLSAISAATGDLQWVRGSSQRGYGPAFSYPPLADGDRVYVSGPGGFYALSKSR